MGKNGELWERIEDCERDKELWVQMEDCEKEWRVVGENGRLWRGGRMENCGREKELWEQMEDCRKEWRSMEGRNYGRE